MFFISKLLGVAAGHNTELFAFAADNAHFTCPNFFVDTQVFFSYDKSPPKYFNQKKKRAEQIHPR